MKNSFDEDYQQMSPGVEPPILPPIKPKPKKMKKPVLSDADKVIYL